MHTKETFFRTVISTPSYIERETERHSLPFRFIKSGQRREPQPKFHSYVLKSKSGLSSQCIADLVVHFSEVRVCAPGLHAERDCAAVPCTVLEWLVEGAQAKPNQ